MLLQEEAGWGLWSGLPTPARQPDSSAQGHARGGRCVWLLLTGRLVLAGSAAVAQPSPGGPVASLHPAGGDGASSPREPELRATVFLASFFPSPF